uniref:Repressor n=1 Tax=Myoviridae sp. ctuev19 TaxID=2827716 RepID=A0A8S5SFB9_9CAUD|nr:MAG TPA: repressor [Myoviridae sp. ctuev19]
MPISDKKKITNNRYLSKCVQVSFKPRAEDAAQLKAAAAAAGQSLQGYILQACRERMERDGKPPEK